MSSLLHLFAPGTPASAAAGPTGSGSLPADIDAPAATLARPGCAAGVVAAEVAAAGFAADVEAEASSRPGTGAAVTGPAVEPDIVPDRRVRCADPRRGGPVEGVHGVAAGRPGRRRVRTFTMPAKPR